MPLCAVRSPGPAWTSRTNVHEHPAGCRVATEPPFKKCVLIVDDDPRSRRALYDVLEVRGYQCEVAEHGAAAAVRIKAGRVHLVITDHHMPVMDGLRLLEWLASTLGENAVPAILLTSEWNEAVKTRAVKAGAYSILSKPYCVEVLLSVVARAVSDLDPLWKRREAR